MRFYTELIITFFDREKNECIILIPSQYDEKYLENFEQFHTPKNVFDKSYPKTMDK